LKVRGTVSLGTVLLAAVLAMAGTLRADLQQAKAEPNLEKRSKLALTNAEDALHSAREAYNKGDNAQVEARATEIQESVELAAASLEQTGKNPRRSPKWFKHAEIVTRDLLRQLDAFERDMNVADRPLVEATKAKVQQVHDDLLLGIMEGTPK
jgi:hypothetical protein